MTRIAEPPPEWLCHGCGKPITGAAGVVLIARRDPRSGAVGGPPDPSDICTALNARPYHVGAFHVSGSCIPRTMASGIRVPLITPVSVEVWMASVAQLSDSDWASTHLLSDLLRFWWTGRNPQLPVPLPAPWGRGENARAAA